MCHFHSIGVARPGLHWSKVWKPMLGWRNCILLYIIPPLFILTYGSVGINTFGTIWRVVIPGGWDWPGFLLNQRWGFRDSPTDAIGQFAGMLAGKTCITVPKVNSGIHGVISSYPVVCSYTSPSLLAHPLHPEQTDQEVKPCKSLSAGDAKPRFVNGKSSMYRWLVPAIHLHLVQGLPS